VVNPSTLNGLMKLPPAGQIPRTYWTEYQQQYIMYPLLDGFENSCRRFNHPTTNFFQLEWLW